MTFSDILDAIVNRAGFAARDLQGIDKWETFTPVFGSLAVVGATTYVGRYRIVGAQVFGQVTFKAATSIASTAGTDYLNLPVTKRDNTGTLIPTGITGIGVMTNDTTNIAVGTCHLDVTTMRLYLPTQAASANTFNLWFSYEI